MTYLGHVEIGLHHEEGIEGVRSRGVGVVEEVLDFRKGRLPKACAAILWRNMRLRMCMLETERFRRVGKRSDDPRMKRLHLLESSSEELPLRWRAFVDSDPYKNFSQKGKNAGDIVQSGDQGGFAVRLRKVCTLCDAEQSAISREAQRL